MVDDTSPLANGMIEAKPLAEVIIAHAKRGEFHAIYSLIKARDQIWSEHATANRAAAMPSEEMLACLKETVAFLTDPEIPFPPALHDRITAAIFQAEHGSTSRTVPKGAITPIINLVGDLETYAAELDGEGWHNAANGCREAAKRLRSSPVNRSVALDTAWGKINALGGTVTEYDDFGRGINHAVEQALYIIEELGGQDPLKRKAAQSSGQGGQ